MRPTTLRFPVLFPILLLTAACGGNDVPAPSGPIYLGAGPELWAENITSRDITKKETELNRLSLGRPDAIPVLLILLDHESPEVVLAAYFALSANMTKVERAKADPKPWLPLIEKAAKSTHPRVAELAPALLAKWR